MRLHRLMLLGACLAAAAAGNARACSDPPSPKMAQKTVASPRAAALVAWKPRVWSPPGRAAAAQGLWVSIDPVDGAMGMPPVDESAQALVDPEDRRPVTVIRRTNGSVLAQLDERFAEFAVFRMGADGKPRWTCVHGPSGAARFVNGADVPAPVAPERVEK